MGRLLWRIWGLATSGRSMALVRETNLVREGPQGCLLFVRERLEGEGLWETHRIMVSMVLSALVVINEVPSGVLGELAVQTRSRFIA